MPRYMDDAEYDSFVERRAEALRDERNERASEWACADAADREARWDR